MIKYTYTICSKEDNRPVALCYNRKEARIIKNELESEYPENKFQIHQMVVNKRVR